MPAAGLPVSAALSGCSDPVSTAVLEPVEISVTRVESGWRSRFVVRLELTALSESEGVSDVAVELLDRDGEAVYTEELGDFVWNELPRVSRDVRSEDVVFYDAVVEEPVSAATDVFPSWITVDVGDFTLTRAAPEITTKRYAGGDDGEPPESTVDSGDWESVNRENLSR